MRAIVYVRNSSGKQADRGTHEGQLDVARADAARLGAEVVALYADPGVSAKSGNLAARGDFARLVADLPKLRPDVCIVANVDRLTRTDLFRELGEIWGPLQEAGVKVATAGGGIIDLSTPEGQLLAMFESWRSARENAARSTRSKAGRLRAIRAGRNPGRTPYGYQHAAGEWSCPGADVVREIYQRAADGQSGESIAGLLNARGIPSARGRRWTGGGVRDIVRPRRSRGNGDPYVTGLWFGQRGEPAIPVPAIVPEDLAARARSALAARAQTPPPSTRGVYYLDGGSCVCGACSAPIRVRNSWGRRRADGTRLRYQYYVCDQRARTSASGGCSLPPRRVDRVDPAVFAAVLAAVQRRAVERDVADELARERTARADLDAATAALAEENARLDALADALGSGALSADAYRSQVARVTARRDLLAQQVATWTAATRPPDEPTAELRWQIRAALLDGDVATRRDTIRALCPSWVMRDREVEALRSGSGIGEAIPLPARIVVAA